MQLSSYRLEAVKPNAIELVLIHGWGASSSIWQEWLPLLSEHCHVTLIDLPGYGDSPVVENIDQEKLFRAVVSLAPSKAVYLGYSLGGMLAVKIAQHYPERVMASITFASNLRFVANDLWHSAMDETTYKNFYNSVSNDYNRALKTFSVLQSSGASNEKVVIKTLRKLTNNVNKIGLLSTLRLLSEIDNTHANVKQPSLYIYGDSDQLVPVDVINEINENKLLTLKVLANSPHGFFISDPKLSWDVVFKFLLENKIIQAVNERNLNKQQIARSFSRAACSYDSVADLQRQVGSNLLLKLPDVDADTIIDLGCGTGFFTEKLKKQYPQSTVVGLDLAEGMVSYAASKKRNKEWLCADAECLPFVENSVDVIFSSLAIQWCEDTDQLFSEIFRVLKPEGYFLFSTLGPNTLFELKKAWSTADEYVHVNKFVDKVILDNVVKNTGFVDGDLELKLTEEIITLQYSTLKELTRELKSLGANNINSGRPSGLTGKRRIQKFIEGYEQQRNSQNYLPASYQTWYGCLQKPKANDAFKAVK